MDDFWYNHVKPKYIKKKSKIMLCGYRQFHCPHKKQKIFMRTLQKILKKDLIMSQKDRLQKGTTKNVISLMEDELGGKIMKYFVKLK